MVFYFLPVYFPPVICYLLGNFGFKRTTGEIQRVIDLWLSSAWMKFLNWTGWTWQFTRLLTLTVDYGAIPTSCSETR